MEAKQINILHLYYDLMNLYGDWANAAVLERELDYRGFNVRLDKKSVGDDIDFSGYDFIYIGSGTERSFVACMRDLSRFKDAFIECIETGVYVLATGNSHELFGQSVTDCDGNEHEMLGLLDFETVQSATRVTGDCVFSAKPPFYRDKLIGFINRAGGSQTGEIERPFSVEPGAGAGFKACDEGIMYKNLLGTYMTGPLLVRNPPMMMYFADKLTGERAKHESKRTDMFFEYQGSGYYTALDELK
ncbi:MAG: glutamine amidotransferase [Oscillospiraceae bacterium]|nr:glutamine amidotransferase [Oscillospiraceae bacterium]